MDAIYFAYGSNMGTGRLAERVPGARCLGRAWVDGMRLAFNKPGRDGTGKANLIPAPGERAWGVAYRLPADGLERLDRFEPGYARTHRTVEIDGRGAVTATLYLWEKPDAEIPPAASYLALVVAGAREHGLPEAYRARIAAVAAAADAASRR